MDRSHKADEEMMIRYFAEYQNLFLWILCSELYRIYLKSDCIFNYNAEIYTYDLERKIKNT